jgi:hypothetical protein
VRREFEYRRNGTAVRFAGLNVHEGDGAAWVTDSTRTENLVDFLGDLGDQTRRPASWSAKDPGRSVI